MSSIEAKAVLLDFDDTIVYTMKPIWALHKHVAREHYGVELQDEHITPHWGKPLAELVQIIYRTDDPKRAFENIKTVKDRPEFRKQFIDPTHQTLHRLRAGRKLGIVTAHIREILDIEFAYLELAPSAFDYLQTSDDTEYHKPDPAVFAPALRWLASQGVAPSETVYVGDGLHDMEAALGAGLRFIGVETGLVTRAAFEAAGATSVADVSHVPDVLR